MELSNKLKGQRRKVKGFVLSLLLLTATANLCSAQTFSEWFAQKSTQKKYLLLQIEALEQYGKFLKQGYEISQSGLGTIGNWAKGEFNLHGAYYNSLRTVNPEIKKNPKANECLVYASGIAKAFGGLKVDDAEIVAYIRSVSEKVLDDTDKDISELELVIKDGETDFTDDERIKRLDAIHKRLKDKYAFTRHYCDQVRGLLKQREQVLKDIETERRLYEVPN